MDRANINQKLTILYIIPRFHPHKGGAEQNILATASYMARRGHDVHLFTTDFKYRDKKPVDFETYQGIKIYRLKSFIQRPYYLLLMPSILTKLLKFKADIIHVSGFGFPTIDIPIFLKKKFDKKAKIINTPHGPFMAGHEGNGILGVMKKIYTFWLKILIKYSYDKIIAVVPKQTEWMKSEYGIDENKVITIPNGIEKKYLEEKIKEYSKEDKVIITYLNRMEWYKGIQTVLSAINKLNRQEKYRDTRADITHKPLPEYEFWVMGRPGPFTENLKNMVERDELTKQVKFVFSPSDEERDDIFYNKSQINILPSKWEATGITLIEAMAKGNVVITTNQNQSVDVLINEGVTGFKFDFGDVDKLADILRKLLEDYELRQSIREHNFKFASEFTWESVLPKYEEMVLGLSI